MIQRIKASIQSIRNAIHGPAEIVAETQSLLLGKLLADRNINLPSVSNLEMVEFKVFSQFGDDGIIQWLTHALRIEEKFFIEFGVEDYQESNTRFLLMNDNWSGLVIDGSAENIDKLRGKHYFWKSDLIAKSAFIDRDNINGLLQDQPFGSEIGLLHIDIDGNDYWIWDAIQCVRPAIAIVEYNSVFGPDRPITIPYRADFQRSKAHYSNLYFGASLTCLCDLASLKGYTFIGCNGAGNNAYFVRNDKLNPAVEMLIPNAKYIPSKFREARNAAGQLTFVAGTNRLEAIRDMPVWDTRKNEIVKL